MKRPTIIQALTDTRIFGRMRAPLTGASWRNWRIVLSAMYGLPLADDEQSWFCKHTGRSSYTPPSGGWPEIVAVTARQSGKTRIGSVVAAYEAAFPTVAATGEHYALLIAQDQRGAVRTALSYARAPFSEVPALKAAVITDVSDTLALNTGVTIAAYPCRPGAVRGLRSVVAVADELAFFRTSDGNPTDLEMLRALRPGLATTGGKLLVLSSPYFESGALYDLHRRHYGRESKTTLVIQASAPELNPTLPEDYLERMKEDDPEAYRAEVLGEFRSGIGRLLDPNAIEARVEPNCRERLPQDGVAYFGFCDPASGSGKDRFAVAVSHVEGDTAVLDAVRSWSPPFNPSGAIAEAVQFFKCYRVAAIHGDRYAAGFVLEAFRGHGLRYIPSERDRSQIYLELLPLINAGTARLLDLPELLRELRGLERRRGAAGRDRVDHAPGAHDDLANAAAGALALAADGRTRRSGAIVVAVNRRPLSPALKGLLGTQSEDDAWDRWRTTSERPMRDLREWSRL